MQMALLSLQHAVAEFRLSSLSFSARDAIEVAHREIGFLRQLSRHRHPAIIKK
jgi:hypothetical protein